MELRSAGGVQRVVYRLVMRSKLPPAERFEARVGCAHPIVLWGTALRLGKRIHCRGAELEQKGRLNRSPYRRWAIRPSRIRYNPLLSGGGALRSFLEPMTINRHGLPRHIPAAVSREVRQRSKFGCVLCRSGFYEYEHIEPAFEDALSHDPAHICCLCSSCHSAVTRGHRSKASVAAAYADIQAKTDEEAGLPIGPLDFHGGRAELSIGGLHYSPLVQAVLRYNGEDIIKVVPGENGTPGKISAIFTNDVGEPILELVENTWVGSTANWDIEVIGPRITVRNAARRIALQLRLDPPGLIVVERLDMRIADSHLLVSETAYAAGRYLPDGSIFWVHANLAITRSSACGAAIEFADPQELQTRDQATAAQGQRLATSDGMIVMSSSAGCMCIPAGISIASLCGGFHYYGSALGLRPIDGVRRMVIHSSRTLMRYLGTGEEAPAD